MNVKAKMASPPVQRMGKVRQKLVLDQAMAAGWLGPDRDGKVSAYVPASLLAAARERAQVGSDSELLEIALSLLALEDDFGKWLVSHKGKIPADIDLGF